MDKRKKIVFEDLEVNYAKLKLRLRHDGLRQSEFFSFIVQKYVDCDPKFLTFISQLKAALSRHGKKRQKRSEADLDLGHSLLGDLGITDSDREEIFDLIEKEYEDF